MELNVDEQVRQGHVKSNISAGLSHWDSRITLTSGLAVETGWL